MSQSPDQLIDSLYRQKFSAMVIGLARYTGLRELATAEDAVQEAFAEAAVKWRIELPDKPDAWLYRVSRNIALKKIRDNKAGLPLPHVDAHPVVIPEEHAADEQEDQQLAMLLACVHPAFSTRNQVIFALRYVAGFRLEQIATILGSPVDTISKTLLRMRNLIREENIVLRPGTNSLRKEEVLTLLKILYLLFSEGSKTSSGKSMLNIGLCEDAISLTQTVVRSQKLNCPEAHALFALMLFNLSRFEARFDSDGVPVDLEHQDRSLWNKDMIRVAIYHLNQAGKEDSSYHVEAAIAYTHAIAPAFAETDWNKISLLYERLSLTNESPFVKLSHAVAIFYAGNQALALEKLLQLGETAFIQSYNLYHAALGKIYAASDQVDLAKVHYTKAIELSTHEPERIGLRRMMDALN